MFEFVNKLLDSKDNIIDQLELLKKNKNNKEVQEYINELVKQNLSPYFRYCIDKYYFEKDVKEVKPSVPKLRPLYYLKGYRKIEKILEKEDSLINQIKVLKEYKGTKMVDNYIEEYLNLYSTNQYTSYCIKKYYYDMELEEVKPTAKNLNIALYKNCYLNLLISEEIKRRNRLETSFKNLKKGDKVKIIDGPFAGTEGIVHSFDIEELKIVVGISMFDEIVSCECSDSFEIIKEDKNEK